MDEASNTVEAIDAVLEETLLGDALASVFDLLEHSVTGANSAFIFAPSRRRDTLIDRDAREFAERYLHNIHGELACLGQVCVIHRPTLHALRSWPLVWRNDRQIFERICVCGVGHPDPDQKPYWISRGQEWQMIHACCGCCQDDDL